MHAHRDPGYVRRVYRLNIWLRGRPWARDVPLYAVFVLMWSMGRSEYVLHTVL